MERETVPETTINNARDFGINKGLNHLSALRQVGFSANRRLLDVQRISHDCRVGEDAFRRVNEPVQVDGQRASALRFAEPVVQALFGARLVFRRLPRGFCRRELREHWAPLIGKAPESITAGQMTYHLRRLRLHGLIARVPKSHRYRVTESGWRTMLFCTRCYSRLLRPGLAEVLPPEAACDTPLRRRFDELDEAIQKRLKDQALAA